MSYVFDAETRAARPLRFYHRALRALEYLSGCVVDAVGLVLCAVGLHRWAIVRRTNYAGQRCTRCSAER